MKIFIVAVVCMFMVCCKPKEQASKDSRAEWNKATSLDAYEKHGNKNQKWDSDAKRSLTEFLKLRAGITNYEQRTLAFNMAGTYASGAIAKGCDDPLIEYLYCRFGTGIEKEERTKRYCSAADKMQGSLYAPVRKFFANFRASQALWQDRDTNVWDRVAQYETAAINNFVEMAQDRKTPIEEIDETGHELVETVARQDWALKMIIEGAEPLLLKNWPDEDVTHSIKAFIYYNYAWRARGGGYADKVTDEGWKGFGERLAIATESANKSWSLNPKNTRIPTLMIKLAEANQQPRKEMETWFAKAMELEPNNYEACEAKLHYLYPQWYGSAEEMISFGRECVQSDVWTGTVHLIMVDAHEQLAIYIRDKERRKAYWKDPEVWKDIASAYERFFEKNPDGISWRHNYAKYAYICEQWGSLNEQIKLLGEINYSYFGGEEEFFKMVELAKANSQAAAK